MLLKLVPRRLWSPLPSLPDNSRRGGAQDAAEGGAFHVARRGARSGVPVEDYLGMQDLL
jgi:hypothetical protein